MAGRMGRPEKTCNTLQTFEQGNSRDIAAATVGMSGEQYAHGDEPERVGNTLPTLEAPVRARARRCHLVVPTL